MHRCARVPNQYLVENSTHTIIGECELCKEARDVLEEEMIEIDECDMGGYGALESSEKTIVILGGRRWPQAAKQEGDKTSKKFRCIVWKQNVMSAQRRRCLY